MVKPPGTPDGWCKMHQSWQCASHTPGCASNYLEPGPCNCGFGHREGEHRQRDQASRDQTVADLRAKYIARNPDALERKAHLIQTFREDVNRNRAWLPGASFIANPGLDSYILGCLENWNPAGNVHADTRLWDDRSI